jgi:uncharacterized protein YrrD
MQTIKEGTRVETTGGDRVGSVTRVIIDPRTKEITHIVVGKGLLFREDRVIPVELMVDSNDERLLLDKAVGELEDFPEFEVRNFVTFDERDIPEGLRDDVLGRGAPSAYLYPGVGPNHYWGGSTITMTPYAFHPQGSSTVTTQNIPDETVGLKKGASVICEDGEKAGELDELMVNDDNQATHMVISRGLLSTDKTLLPVDWIEYVTEDEVHVSVRSEVIDRLRSYE